MILLSIQIANAQNKDRSSDWIMEAGPSFALPIRTLHTSTSFAVGADFKVSHPVSSIDNFSVGARVSYNLFFSKKFPGLSQKPKNVNNIGLFASFQYLALEKLILEADLGLGISTNWINTLGFARGGFIGYQLPNTKKPITVGVFMNRITFATLHAGVKAMVAF